MSRTKIIETAHAQLGVTENPPNSNKTIYGKWYGFDGYAWCAMFVSWVYHHAGHPLGHIDDAKGYRDCNSAYWKWRASKEFTENPEPGDIVLFDWEGDGRCNHTGIFHEWADGAKKTFWTYEGNTAVGNDSNGGVVMRRKRFLSTVKAFVKPATLTGGSTGAQNVEEGIVYKKGSLGADVVTLQKHLYDLGYKLTVDGEFGPETEKTVKQFQKEHKLNVTGTVTATLLGFIESKLNKPSVKEEKLVTGAYLKKGNNGQMVVLLQKALNKAGAKPKLKEDGVYGDITLKAVKEYQKKKGLKVDGIAGPQTIGSLGLKI